MYSKKKAMEWKSYFRAVLLAGYRGGAKQSNSKKYKTVRDLVKDKVDLITVVERIHDLFADEREDSILKMDEDAIIVTSNPWYALDYRHGYTAADSLEDGLPSAKSLIKSDRPNQEREEDLFQKELFIRRIMYFSLTGFPSFHETLNKEKEFIGMCSCGLDSRFDYPQSCGDPLQSAFDSHGHVQTLKELVNKCGRRQKTKPCQFIPDSLISKIKEGITTSNIKPTYAIFSRQMNSTLKNDLKNFLKTLKKGSHDIEVTAEIERLCNIRFTEILENHCKVDVNGETVSWNGVHDMPREDDVQSWRNAEGEILAQVVAFGMYIRLYFLIYCSAGQARKKITAKESSKPRQSVEAREVNPLIGAMIPTKSNTSNTSTRTQIIQDEIKPKTENAESTPEQTKSKKPKNKKKKRNLSGMMN